MTTAMRPRPARLRTSAIPGRSSVKPLAVSLTVPTTVQPFASASSAPPPPSGARRRPPRPPAALPPLLKLFAGILAPRPVALVLKKLGYASELDENHCRFGNLVVARQ